MIVTHPNGVVRVELEDIGEGWAGDWQIDDPDDEPLLRFTVERRGDEGQWEAYDDASYCTALRADLPDDVQRACAQLILDEVVDPVVSQDSVKKLCERLSWIGSEQFGPLPSGIPGS